MWKQVALTVFVAETPASPFIVHTADVVPSTRLQHFRFNTERFHTRLPSPKSWTLERHRRQRKMRPKVGILKSLHRALTYNNTDLESLDWHTIHLQELYTRLSSSPTQGLSTEQVKRRLTQYGRNLPSSPPTHYFKTIFGYFFKGFGSILLVGAILVMVAWKPLGEPAPAIANLALSIVLFAVFFIQAAFNAWQDWSSSRVMASITTMLPDSCLVLRDGAQVTLMATEIVPGDVLYIKAGNKLPADVRFVETSSDAKFDRSILTGKCEVPP